MNNPGWFKNVDFPQRCMPMTVGAYCTVETLGYTAGWLHTSALAGNETALEHAFIHPVSEALGWKPA